MSARKHIALIVLILLANAAAVRAQLVFEPASHDFGSVPESGGTVSHTFAGVNRSERPLVILDVVSSCGCTVPEFSRRPILPGDSTRITVTFDPMNRPGSFSKELGIYSTDRVKVATLAIRGEVAPRPKSIDELYPVDAGGGVRLSVTLCAFSYVRHGQRMQMAVGIANTSDRSVSIEPVARQSSGLLEIACPRRLAPGERAEINLSYFIPASEPHYGTLRDVFEIRVDGASNGTLLLAHGIGIDPEPKRRTNRPVSELSENMLKFGAVKHAGPILRRKFTLSNTGSGELIVRAAEHDGRIATTLTAGERIPAGGSVTAEVLFDPGEADYGIMSSSLLLITNDPDRPMRRLRVTAIVEE